VATVFLTEISEMDQETLNQIREQVEKQLKPPHHNLAYWLTAFLNLLFFPALLWLAMSQAQLLPVSLSGYFSVVLTVFLVRVCILEKGIG